ncbi:MAG: restriction endonuclease [Elusimicrobia bacterium CG_4_9_14_3_um_filter_62_55]|nr:MAG: restriction endonuclease [Elusimicrobia bacterium CG22_combo_CG10-13_8_21_14_all_63_91]PJA18508.1 MAG: restriction endonuclease [Elusimicrobia bacterium CG_4_10_14_0_2_um_filter_63_34]PJB26693.1 MAG: restriction endonuclease [Elusimicrobia bacterium CG_4_9_14_3_um_filter_62_55]
MAIPDYQSLMLPLLEFAADGKDHTNREGIDHLAQSLELTEDEQQELLPSGQQRRFDNRVQWARSYLKQAGLLENPARGTFRITDEGRKVLQSKPEAINIKFLKQFEKFKDFQNRSHKNGTGKDDASTDEAKTTPKEVLEENYEKLKNELAAELLDTVKQCSPKFFENLVVELLLKMGYGGSRKEAGMAVGRSGDGGIDGIINEDRLGLNVIYIQAKRWENTINDEQIRTFVGSLAGKNAARGVFITTSAYTQRARDYSSGIQQKVVLIDGEKLADLMIEHGVGVSTVAAYEIKKIDADYFAEE